MLPAAASESPVAAGAAEVAAVVPAMPAPDQAASAGKTVRELDADSIRLLMQQGAQFVAAGDLVTARLVYQRAAESGDAAAALALGATFDPAVLAKIGVRGMGADIEKARSWYEKAKQFGSPEAPRRLELLANR
jgi:TPR repeat protein